MTLNDYCIASSEFVHIFFLVALYSLLSDKHFIVLSFTSNINMVIAWLRSDTLEYYKILLVKLHDLLEIFFFKSRLAH